MKRDQLTRLAATLAITLGLTCGQALGQNDLGDGYLLDNNLQVGSGGVNQPNASPNGGRSGQLYESNRDRVARLRAETLNTINQTRSQGDIYNRSLQRNEFAGDQVIVRDYDGTLRLIDRQIASQLTDQGLLGTTPDTIAIIPQPSGRALQVTASPLLGVRQRTLDSTQQYLNPIQPRTYTAAGSSLDPGLAGTASTSTPPASPGGDQNAVDLNTYRQDARQVDPMRDAAAFDSLFSDGGAAPRTASLFGQALAGRLDTSVRAQRLGDPLADLGESIEQVRERLTQVAAGQPMPAGYDVYRDLMTVMAYQAAVDAGRSPQPPVQQQVIFARPLVPDDANADRTGALPDQEVMAIGADQPTPEELAAAEAQRLAAVRRAMGLTDSKGDATGDLGIESELPPVDPLDQRGKDQEVQKTLEELNALLKTLSTDMPQVKSLAGERSSRFNDLMSRAESKLAAGEYFDAEELYDRALTNVPGHPLARIGKIHAEMGAGMIRTSATALRHLFEDHPELIAVRYAPRVLPPVERLRWVQNECLKLIKDNPDAVEPALLLAYIGHQRNSQGLTQFGLDLAQKRSADPLDPFLLLLRRMWLGESPDGEPSPPATEPQPGEPAP